VVDELVLEGPGGGGDHHTWRPGILIGVDTGSKFAGEVGEAGSTQPRRDGHRNGVTLTDPGRGLHHEVVAAVERVGHGVTHLGLSRPVLSASGIHHGVEQVSCSRAQITSSGRRGGRG
jgi:hypothetical protein